MTSRPALGRSPVEKKREWRLPAVTIDMVFVLGLVLFGVGLSLWWPPAGLVGAGVMLMAISIIGALRR